MSAYIVRRFMQTVIVLVIMSMLVFFGVYAIGNPLAVLIHPQADQKEIKEAAKRLGLDRPIWEQYLIYMKNIFRGHFGVSFVFNEPSLKVILQRMPATAELVFCSFIIAILIGIPLGMIAGLRPNTIIGRTIIGGSIFGFSLPSFWVGLMLIMSFSVYLGWLPSGGRGPTTNFFGVPVSIFNWEGLKHIILPAINLSLVLFSTVLRLAFAGTQETMLMDFIKFARAKGIPEIRIILVHLLKNIMIPIITILGLEFGNLLSFSVVTESVFAWPGIGKILIHSIENLDRPVVVAYLLIVVVIFLLTSLLVDILYSILDPRVKISGSGT